MSAKDLREAVDDVVSGRAKMTEVVYGDDGVDMAKDIKRVIKALNKCLDFIGQGSLGTEDGHDAWVSGRKALGDETYDDD